MPIAHKRRPQDSSTFAPRLHLLALCSHNNRRISQCLLAKQIFEEIIKFLDFMNLNFLAFEQYFHFPSHLRNEQCERLYESWWDTRESFLFGGRRSALAIIIIISHTMRTLLWFYKISYCTFHFSVSCLIMRSRKLNSWGKLPSLIIQAIIERVHEKRSTMYEQEEKWNYKTMNTKRWDEVSSELYGSLRFDDKNKWAWDLPINLFIEFPYSHSSKYKKTFRLDWANLMSFLFSQNVSKIKVSFNLSFVESSLDWARVKNLILHKEPLLSFLSSLPLPLHFCCGLWAWMMNELWEN